MTTFTTQDRQDAQRTPLTGDLRVNVDTDRSEIYDGGKWVPIVERNKPLTELQIKALHKYVSENMMQTWRESEDPKPFMIEFARALERAHGIDK